jgi:hypothetical protein
MAPGCSPCPNGPALVLSTNAGNVVGGALGLAATAANGLTARPEDKARW